MSKLTINFNTALENSQQKIFLKNLKECGFSVQRVFQSGDFIEWHYYARLPCYDKLSSIPNVDIMFSDSEKSEFISKNIDSIEFIVYFERKN